MSVDRPRSRGAHLAMSLAAGACFSAMAYAFACLVQRWVYPAPDPRVVTHVSRIAFHWRLWLSGWLGVLGAIGASALFSRSPARAEATLPALAVAAAIASTVQGVFFP